MKHLLSALARRFNAFSNPSTNPIPSNEFCKPSNRFFDTQWYLNMYGDVRAVGIDPFVHYKTFGANEMRSPNSFFNAQAYANSIHWDIESQLAPFDHFLDNLPKVGPLTESFLRIHPLIGSIQFNVVTNQALHSFVDYCWRNGALDPALREAFVFVLAFTKVEINKATLMADQLRSIFPSASIVGILLYSGRTMRSRLHFPCFDYFDVSSSFVHTKDFLFATYPNTVSLIGKTNSKLLHGIVSQIGRDAVLLRPDSCEVEDVSRLTKALDSASIVLFPTPDIDRPDYRSNWQLDAGIISTGVYDNQFLMVKASDQGKVFAEWYFDRNHSREINSATQAPNAQSRWLDLALSLFSEAIVIRNRRTTVER